AAYALVVLPVLLCGCESGKKSDPTDNEPAATNNESSTTQPDHLKFLRSLSTQVDTKLLKDWKSKTPITLKFSNAAFSTVLKSIEKQSGVEVEIPPVEQFSSPWGDTLKVSVDVEGVSLLKALSEVSKAAGGVGFLDTGSAYWFSRRRARKMLSSCVIGPIMVGLEQCPIVFERPSLDPEPAAEDCENFDISVWMEDVNGSISTVGYPIMILAPPSPKDGDVRYIVPNNLCDLPVVDGGEGPYTIPNDLRGKKLHVKVGMLLAVALDPKEFSIPLGVASVKQTNGFRLEVQEPGMSEDGYTIARFDLTWAHGAKGPEGVRVDRLARSNFVPGDRRFLLGLQAAGKMRKYDVCRFAVYDTTDKPREKLCRGSSRIASRIGEISGSYYFSAHSKINELRLAIAPVRYTYVEFDLGEIDSRSLGTK
ncbi:MAG: hypothetical protein HN350_19940, partial [Phycisphaerales bacterium]|nr:hypothetical protein [Phycisphaerales bacterium]